MEYLKFSSGGQWSLCKAASIVSPKSIRDAAARVDKPYKVYGGNSLTGELHEDRGQRGALHNFGGGKRPKNAYNKRTAGKPAHPEHSVVSERNPGLGEEEVG